MGLKTLWTRVVGGYTVHIKQDEVDTDKILVMVGGVVTDVIYRNNDRTLPLDGQVFTNVKSLMDYIESTMVVYKPRHTGGSNMDKYIYSTNNLIFATVIPYTAAGRTETQAMQIGINLGLNGYHFTERFMGHVIATNRPIWLPSEMEAALLYVSDREAHEHPLPSNIIIDWDINLITNNTSGLKVQYVSYDDLSPVVYVEAGSIG
ncbi:hypothetical protein D1872_51390 [compost metagenome]